LDLRLFGLLSEKFGNFLKIIWSPWPGPRDQILEVAFGFSITITVTVIVSSSSSSSRSMG
jgi:hypothetical protein